ncbi:hypothetical protein T4B_2467, partial [Trichinella pseudospiralis]
EGSHSPSDQLPIPGKGSPSGQSSPSYDAVPGLTIPKQDGNKHIPSDALRLPTGQKHGSGSSSPTHTNVPGLPIKKDEGSHSPSDQLPIPGKGSTSGTTSPSHDAVPGLTIPKRILSHDMPCETFN